MEADKIFLNILLILLFKINFCVSSDSSSEIKFLSLKQNIGPDFMNYIKLHRNTFDNVNNATCWQQLAEVQKGLLNYEQWAIEMTDSWGKIPSGIFWGHLINWGNFDECVNITHKTSINLEKLQGKYCTARIPLKSILEKIPILKLRESLDFTKKETIRAGSDLPNLISSIVIGVCVPSSCGREILNDVFKQFFNIYWNITLDESYEIIGNSSCSKSYKDVDYEVIDIFAITFFILIGIIILLSTIYDYVMQYNNLKPYQIMISFSLLTNGKKLFSAPRPKSQNIITCLAGIRSLSIIWVIMGHRYHWASFGLPFLNYIKLKDWYTSIWSLVLQNANVSVDTFFFLSGFLIAWVGFKEMIKSKGKLNVPMMYFHRYVRLTPVVAVVILFQVSLYRYLGSGPQWDNWENSFRGSCEKNWWQTLLYVMNYVNPNEPCLLHTWYLCVDTQLYLLSPLLLIPTWKWGKKFLYPSTIVTSLLSISCCFTTFMIYGFTLTRTQPSPPPEIDAKRNQLIYFPTHTRVTPWMIGFVLGHFMHENKEKEFNIPKKFVLMGWSSFFALIATIIFGTYDRVQPGSYATTIEGAFYEALAKVGWSFCLAWMVFACHNNYGGFINSFLSYSFWQIFARITYCFYLIHLLVVLYHDGNFKSDAHYSEYETHYILWGDIGITTLISVVAVLAFESPILGIEKAIFGNNESKVEKKNKVIQTEL